MIFQAIAHLPILLTRVYLGTSFSISVVVAIHQFYQLYYSTTLFGSLMLNVIIYHCFALKTTLLLQLHLEQISTPLETPGFNAQFLLYAWALILGTTELRHLCTGTMDSPAANTWETIVFHAWLFATFEWSKSPLNNKKWSKQ